MLGITAITVGRILELLGYRSNKHVIDSAVAAGCGVRRWDGCTMHDDWHLDRAVSAIRSAAQSRGEPVVADALAAAIAKQQGRERVLARKRKEEEEEAARRQEKKPLYLGYRLSCERYTDPGMSLLDAVEFITSDPAHRVALYNRCIPEDWSIRSGGEAQDDTCLLKIPASAAKDLALLERRAKAEGF